MEKSEANSDKICNKNASDRIPNLGDCIAQENSSRQIRNMGSIDGTNFTKKKTEYILYNYTYREETKKNTLKKEYNCYGYCFISVCISFIFGLLLGVIIMSSNQTQRIPSEITRRLPTIASREVPSRTLNSLKMETVEINKIDNKDKKRNDKFATVSFTGSVEPHKYNKEIYPKGLSEDMKDILKDNKVNNLKHKVNEIYEKTYVPNDQTVLFNDVFWGPKVENSMPQGYGRDTADIWERYVNQSEVAKMETGCGRMQNRLVTFKDGIQACVRYRQNTDQIQGEIFSFYVAKLLNLTNLAPSVVKVVDLKDKLWRNVVTDISTAQWNTNRAVVLTQYIPSLESATIPEIFKPANRHLNKYDVLKISMKENNTDKQILIEKLKTKNLKSTKIEMNNFDHIDMELSKKTVGLFVELAQWSDLIIFDYLTANLDRIVNNLFNYQWNINIMDAPAHNLARKMDSGLLLFLDNESGLLHGYRLLKKYNVYHSLMLDNLCVFRKTTVEALRKLYELQTVGVKLNDMFHRKNNALIRDILPSLPEKNVKILHERIGKVLNQIEKCEQNYSNR